MQLLASLLPVFHCGYSVLLNPWHKSGTCVCYSSSQKGAPLGARARHWMGVAGLANFPRSTDRSRPRGAGWGWDRLLLARLAALGLPLVADSAWPGRSPRPLSRVRGARAAAPCAGHRRRAGGRAPLQLQGQRPGAPRVGDQPRPGPSGQWMVWVALSAGTELVVTGHAAGTRVPLPSELDQKLHGIIEVQLARCGLGGNVPGQRH